MITTRPKPKSRNLHLFYSQKNKSKTEKQQQLRLKRKKHDMHNNEYVKPTTPVLFVKLTTTIKLCKHPWFDGILNSIIYSYKTDLV